MLGTAEPIQGPLDLTLEGPGLNQEARALTLGQIRVTKVNSPQSPQCLVQQTMPTNNPHNSIPKLLPTQSPPLKLFPVQLLLLRSLPSKLLFPKPSKRQFATLE